jgi:hypothetical protein
MKREKSERLNAALGAAVTALVDEYCGRKPTESKEEFEAVAQLIHIADFLTGDYDNGKWNLPRTLDGKNYLTMTLCVDMTPGPIDTKERKLQ